MNNTCLRKVPPGRHSTVTINEQSIGLGRKTPKPFCISVDHGLEICVEQLSLSEYISGEKLTRTAYRLLIVLLLFIQQSSPKSKHF